MLIPVLLSTFGLVLRGIDTEYLYHVPKVENSSCPPQSEGVYPNCKDLQLSPRGECDVGFTGTFPDCVKVQKKQKCRRPKIGTYPDCFIPPCPPGYSGTYPKCKRQPNERKCPVGSFGVFPICEVQLSTTMYVELDEEQSTEENLPATTFTAELSIQVLTAESQFTPTQTSQRPEQASSLSAETFSKISLTNTSQTPQGPALIPTSESCEVGYTGTFPDCHFVKIQKCRRPLIVTFPNCFKPSCPPGYSGTYPKCKRPAGLPNCPAGSNGEFPNCDVLILARSCRGSMCAEISPPSLQSSSQPLPAEQLVTAFIKMKWEDFKRMFNKTYANEIEEEKRKQIFFHNQDIVDAHNKLYEQGVETYSLAINAESDLAHDEYPKVIEVDRNINS